jgi:hypothetical protein
MATPNQHNSSPLQDEPFPSPYFDRPEGSNNMVMNPTPMSFPSIIRPSKHTGRLKKQPAAGITSLFQAMEVKEGYLASPAHFSEQPPREHTIPEFETVRGSSSDDQNSESQVLSGLGLVSGALPEPEPATFNSADQEIELDDMETEYSDIDSGDSGFKLRTEWIGTSQFLTDQNLALQNQVCDTSPPPLSTH